MKQSVVLTLNIVSDEPERVFNALHKLIMTQQHDMQVFLKNRVCSNITEFEIYSTERCCFSLETFQEVLDWLPDYNIRFIVG